VRHKKAAQRQAPGQGAISLRTVAVETPKSFATPAGLNPALTTARTMLAFAGGMSALGAVLRTIRAAAGFFCSINGGIVWLLALAAAAMPRCRASPRATRIRSIRSSFSS